MNKKFIAGLASTLVLGLATSAFAFTDTTTVDAWAGKQINKLVEMKIVEGTGNNAFAPKANVTRAQFAKMIVEAKGLAKENPATPTFSDVATGAWYYGYVEAAAKAGYVIGENGKFNPDQNITREQMAKILVKAAGLTEGTTLNFTDKDAVAPWAKGFVAAVADAKLMQGFNGKFDPKAATNRAQAAVVVYNELVYEGKITPEVASDLLTEINTNTVVIGDKTYDLATDVDYFIGTQLVGKDAIVEDTHVTFTTNAAGNINKLVGSTADYKVATGTLTSTGDDGDEFIIVNDKKINIDRDDEDFYINAIDDEDVITDKAEATYEFKTDDPYFVVYNSNNFATYALELYASNKEGIVDYKGTDKDGKYAVIEGKKYYFDADYEDAGYPIAEAGKKVEFELNSDDEIISISAWSTDLEGITKIPQVKLNGDGNYDVWLPVAKKASDNFNTNIYLHTVITNTSKKEAIVDLIDDEVIDEVAAAPGSAIELDTDAKVYFNGNKIELYDVTKSKYVVVDLNDDATQKATKVSVTAKVAFGLVESIDKSSDKVTAVTINGTKFTYDGVSTKYTSSTKGKVSVVGAAYAGADTIEVGDFAVAVTNADGNIVSFSKLLDAGDFDATVSAKAGQLSHYSENEDGSKKIYVPADTVEVQYSNGTFAWVTFDDNADDDSTTTSMSIKGTKDFANFEVGTKAYFVLNNNGAIDPDSLTQVFDTTVVNSAYSVRYDSDNNQLLVNNAPVYTTNVAYYVFQK